MLFGQPDFFTPYSFSDWILRGPHLSYYSTSALKSTLEQLVDFERINTSKEMRFSVGAVNLRTGRLVYFDNAEITIRPEHVMASGALPPAFPPIEIGDDYYWDGGLVSNTPLQYLLEQEDVRDSLVFQVDLFSARGDLPRDMASVLGRHKDIMYSSRTRNNTDAFRRIHNLRLKLRDALLRVPTDQRTDDDRAILASMEDVPQVNIVHLIYQQKSYEGHAKDYEFSGTSMREHWTAGYEDTRKTLRHRRWLEIPPEDIGMVVHDVHRDDPS